MSHLPAPKNDQKQDPREPLLRLGGKRYSLKIYSPFGLIVFFAVLLTLAVFAMETVTKIQWFVSIGNDPVARSNSGIR